MRKTNPYKKYVLFFVVLLGVGLGVYMWNQPKKFVDTKHFSEEKPPTTPVLIPDTPKPPAASYRSITIQTLKPGAEIAKEVGLENLPLVLAFNRLDVRHIQTGVILTIPKTLDDWSALSPFPTELAVAEAIPKLMLISQRVQAFAIYENGKQIRWGPVSSGKKDTPTPSKLYSTNWKGKLVTSSLEGAYLLPWAFNLDSTEGISMHQFDLPGYPASHACVRMLEADAEWIYNWADQWILSPDGNTEIASGTPVIIFGQYAFGKTAPWKKLPTDATASTVTTDELTEVITPELQTIKAKQDERATIIHS